jgi:hypothetical protein
METEEQESEQNGKIGMHTCIHAQNKSKQRNKEIDQ